MGKERPQLEIRKPEMRKLTGKRKHNTKVGNDPLTNMISKLMSVRRGQMQNTENAFEVKMSKQKQSCTHIDRCIKI